MFGGRLRPSEIEGYITAYGGPSITGSTPRERWVNFLYSKTGSAGGIRQLEMAYLSSLGYTGTLSDMIGQFAGSEDGLRRTFKQQDGNLVTNPLFAQRTGDDFTAWNEVVGGTSTITADTSDFVEGDCSVKFTIDATNSLAAITGMTAFNMTVTPSTNYRFLIRAKSDVAGIIQIQLTDGSTLYLQDNGTWAIAADFRELNTTSVWQVFTVDCTTGAGQTVLRVGDVKRSGTGSQAGKTFWIDKIQVFAI